MYIYIYMYVCTYEICKESLYIESMWWKHIEYIPGNIEVSGRFWPHAKLHIFKQFFFVVLEQQNQVKNPVWQIDNQLLLGTSHMK